MHDGDKLALRHATTNGGIRWRVGAVVLLAALGVQGLPLDGRLAAHEPVFAQLAHEAALAAATTIGVEKSLFPAFYWGALYLVALCVVIRNGQLSFIHALRRQWPITALIVWIPLSMAWAVDGRLVLINSAHAVGMLFIAFAAAMYYWDKLDLLVRHLGLVLGLNVAIHVIAVALFPSLTISYEGRWAGLTTNANTLGGLAFLSIWANVTAVFLRADWNRGVSAILIVLAIVALLGSASVTGGVASVAAVGVLAVARMGALIRVQASHAVFMVAAIVAVLIVLIGVDLNWISSLVGRSVDFTGRVVIWDIGYELVKDRPLVGWGYDNNASVIAATGIPTMHFHNGLLDLAVRGGAAALLMLFLALYQLLRFSGLREARFRVTVLSFVVSMLVYNFTEVSFAATRNPQWIVFLTLAMCAIPRKNRVVR